MNICVCVCVFVGVLLKYINVQYYPQITGPYLLTDMLPQHQINITQ